MAGGRPVLLSWGGSMFEYLMPLLVMPAYAHTLLDQTYQAMVARQIAYGEKQEIFWGISESGYNTTDANRLYQYRAFGVPGLGFRRGLSDDLVIAPYASALALMVAPEAATGNLQSLAAAGLAGPYGLYEALDYTPARLARGQKYAVVSSYMAHHQGMVLLSLAFCLLDQPMQKRFEAEPEFQAAALLLQERVPKVSPAFSHAFESAEHRWPAREERESLMRVFNTPHTPVPEVHLLSNGRYHVMITAAGGGYSRWKDLALTRWREDATLDDYGLFCYIRDVERNETWSAAFQPVKMREFAARCTSVETALARGDVATALGQLQALAPLDAEDRIGTTRLLQLLLAGQTTLTEAKELARAALARWPDFVPAVLAMAVVASVQGNASEAATLFEKVARLSAAQGRGEDESCALSRAASEHAASGDPGRAMAVLERSLDGRSGLRAVAQGQGAQAGG